MASEPHPEAQAILDAADQRLYPSAHALTPESARERLEELFATQQAEPVRNVENFAIDGPEGPLPVRLYVPDAEGPYPVVVYFHGGGFVAGSLDTHDNVCAGLTRRADCLTISVDYRQPPEHRFPAAVEDSYAALEWVHEFADQLDADTDRVALAGDSAGGNLAAAASLMARDQDGPPVAYQALVYPALASPVVHEFDSHGENGSGYLLELETSQWYGEQYAGSPAHYRNAYFAPLLATDYEGLPPTSVVTAGFDLHRDEGVAYVDRLREAGVDARHHHYEEMIHAFVSLTDTISHAEDALDALGSDLAAAFE